MERDGDATERTDYYIFVLLIAVYILQSDSDRRQPSVRASVGNCDGVRSQKSRDPFIYHRVRSRLTL